MKKVNLIIIALFICSFANAQFNKTNLKLEAAASQPKYRFRNLQLYPIRANAAFAAQHKDLGKFVPLKEALAKKKVAITESGDGEVNKLFVENISKDTIMVLSGEVVQGGKQDRMIAQDFILYPKSGKKDVSVFCVEHGRWQPKNDDMEFKQYSNASSNEVRKAATVRKDQREVWDKVSETTNKNKANTSTGTLTALNESSDFNKQLKKYTDFFGTLVLQEDDVIGVIAVSGDKVLGCDMFASHALLKEHYNNLISAYATEAITSGKQVTITHEKVDQYLQSIIADETKQETEVQKKGTMLKQGKRKLHISTF
jgi:hypothetical protein